MSEREQLEQTIAALETQRAVLGDAVVETALSPLREKLAALEVPVASEQRKQVTILFADVSGFTAMSETMDAEDVRDTMNDLWERLDGAIIAQGGMIDKHIGDCVMALFGAPTAHEDDPERAIRAALAMQEALAAFRQERQAALAMRIGINTGPVLLGGVGTTDEYTAMGDAVNLASRLEHAAPVGGVLISHNTYRHVRGLFSVQVQEPLQVKGKVEPIQTYVVQGIKPRAFRVPTRGIEGIETRMIGRDAELQRLQQALSAVVEEEKAQVITAVGEAGVGKSRLLYEFRNWLNLQPQDVCIFQGRATQEMINLPYSLIRDLFAFRFEIQASDPAAVAREKLEQGIVTLLGTDNEESVEKAHFVGQLIGFDFSASPHLRGIVGDAQQIHDRAFHYVVQLFAATMEDLPVAIYLEDIHWADGGSLDLVDHLVRECGEKPLLVIALTRPIFFERRPLWGERQATHTRLNLRPLSKRNSRRLVEEILQKVENVPPDLQDLIVRGAEGNPFYVEELIRMLIEDGVIVKGVDRWQVEMARLPEVRIPSTLTGVLQARLDRLPMVEREALQRASVVGRIFWDGAVERISESLDARVGKSEMSAALQSARGRELVYQREKSAFAGAQEYIFKHAILRDVTYESVLKRLRRVYHAQVAEWLIVQGEERVGEYAGLIGEHYERAEEKALAAEWYGQAARQAQDTYALESALDYYQRALVLEERWEWRKGQMEVLHILGRREEECAALYALEASPDAPVYEVAYLWGQYYEAVGDYIQAQATVERALAISREQAHSLNEANCLAQLGLIARRQGNYERAKEWYQQALALFQEGADYSSEEATAFAQAFNGLGTVHRQQGSFDEAGICYEQALALDRQSGNRRGEAETLNNLGVTTYYQRDFSEALTYHKQALEIRQAIGDRAGEGTSLFNLAVTIRDQGDYSQAEEYLLAALSIQQAVGNRWEESNIWNDLGVLYQELGDMVQAQQYLQNALSLSQELGDESGQSYFLSNLGLLMRDLGDLDAAEKLLSDGLAIAQKHADQYMASAVISHLGIVSLLAGQYESAIKRAKTALTMRQDLDLRVWMTADLATLALAHLALQDTAVALDCAQQALSILDECQGEGPESPHRDYFVCYQVLSACGYTEAAHNALRLAYNRITTRAEKITNQALRQSFLKNVPINWQVVQEARRVFRASSS